MARHEEPLDGGLWTAEDPAFLREGQLARARNTIYLPGSSSLFRASGREVFGTVTAAASSVVGLRDIRFDNSDHYLLALAGTLLRSAPVGDTGTFSTLHTYDTAPSQLEAAHYRNRFYLFAGTSALSSSIGTNRVAYLSATAVGTSLLTRQHGMLPVKSAPVATASATAFSQTVTGYYEYWTTEVAKLRQDGAEFVMESTFEGDPTTIFVSSTAMAPLITMPQIQNPAITTHWRIYRSPKKDAEKDRSFPVGFMIAEVATATAQVVDGSTTSNTGLVFPGSFNTGTTFYSAFTSASNLGADDGAVATVATSLLTSQSQGCYGFNFGGFSGSVKGIEVEVQGYVSSGAAPVVVECRIGRDRGADGGFAGSLDVIQRALTGLSLHTAAKSFAITSTSAGAPTTVMMGSSTDRWLPTNAPAWSDTDFGSNFMVVLSVSGPATRTMSFDYVRVRVYYGATVDSTVPFPTVVYTFGDITAQVGKNGVPPSSTTGDVYEDSLVVNDVTNPSLIRWSYPGDPDAFPSTYYIDFETRENDRVRAIKVVNDQLLAWLDSSSWRLNYLPSERDASFDRGKAKKPISVNYGCVDPMCVTVFCPGGPVEIAAFVSHHGIHGTDAFNFETYTEGLDWDAITGGGNGTPIALVNDRARSLLLYVFRNDISYGSETYLCLPLSYGELHWSEGRPKACGLNHMRNHAGGNFASLESAWAVQRDSGKVSVYLGYGGSDQTAGAGKVYIEAGTTIPSLDPRIQFTTRTMYLAGVGNEWQLGEIYGYVHEYEATTPTVSYTATTQKTNGTSTITSGAKTLTLGGQALHKPGYFKLQGEGTSISFVATASAFAINRLTIDGTDFGLEDSGR